MWQTDFLTEVLEHDSDKRNHFAAEQSTIIQLGQFKQVDSRVRVFAFLAQQNVVHHPPLMSIGVVMSKTSFQWSTISSRVA